MIPKIIYMCHKNLDKIEIYSKNWKTLNPEYEIKLYDDVLCKKFLLDEYSQLHLDIFNFLEDGPIKADFWRICILNKYGGLYVDADIEPLIPLNKYIENDDDFVTCISSNFDKNNISWQFNPHFILCDKNNIILQNTIELYIKSYNNNKPYDYWGWSICVFFRIEGITEKKSQIIYINDKKFKFLDEINQKKCEYNGEVVLNNRYCDYNTNTHNFVDKTEIYNTKYGLIELYKNDIYISNEFKNGGYWDINTLLKLREYINPDRNILEIGGHCGTSSIIYSKFLNESNKIYVYEPQNNMYNLLVKNINQNNLQHKIIPNNFGVFCFEGIGTMNNVDLDGGGGIVKKRYTEEYELGCNFGGIGLGDDGELINLTTIDNMNLYDIGYIHCDAQGSENFIFSKGLETIEKYRPVILYENNQLYGKYLYDNVCKSYANYKKESVFDIKKYCMEKLNYSKFIDKFNGGIDTLLIP